MSEVTSVILSFCVTEKSTCGRNEHIFDLMDDINCWLIQHYHKPFRSSVDTFANGGEKCFDAVMYVAGFNYFDVDSFIAFLKTIQWKKPERVQVFLQHEQEAKFRIIELKEES